MTNHDHDEVKTPMRADNGEQASTSYESIEIDSGDIMSSEDIDSIRKFIDQCDDEGVEIDFAQLMISIYKRRVAKRDEKGIFLDPIDDAAYIAGPEDVVGFMRPDQVMTHFEDILSAGSSRAIEKLTGKLGPENLEGSHFADDPIQTDPELHEKGKTFLIDHANELIAAGLDPDKLVAALPADQLKDSREVLLSAGASKFKIRKHLFKAAFTKN